MTLSPGNRLLCNLVTIVIRELYPSAHLLSNSSNSSAITAEFHAATKLFTKSVFKLKMAVNVTWTTDPRWLQQHQER
jgi:hypothetical protein